MPGYEVMGSHVGACTGCMTQINSIPSAMQTCDAKANCQGFNVARSGGVSIRLDNDTHSQHYGLKHAGERWGGTTMNYNGYTWYGKNSKK